MRENNYSNLSKEQILNKIAFLETELKLSKDKLSSPEKIKFQDLLENLPVCAWYYIFEKKEYYVSPSIKNILGYSQKEFTDNPFFGIEKVHTDFKQIVYDVWDDLYDHQKLFKIQYPIRNKNDKYIWIEENAFRVYKKDGLTHAEGLIRDINEQKKNELIQKVLYHISNAVNITKDLQELNSFIREELNQIFDTTNFFIALYDEKTDTFTLPYLADEKDKFQTFPAGKTLTAYVLKTNKPFFGKKKDIIAMIKAKKIEFMGTLSETWLGVPLEINNKVTGVLGVQSYHDENAYSQQDLELLIFVSKQVSLSIFKKRTEEELIKKEEENSLIFQAVPDIIFQLSKEGKFLSFKGSKENLYVDSDEFLGKNIHDVMPETISIPTLESIEKALTSNEVISFEYQLSSSIEKQSFFESRIVKSSRNTVLAIIRNITKQKLAEEQIKKSLEEKEILLQEIHHRVKNNLQIIYSMLHLQTETITDKEALHQILNSLNRVKSMALVYEKLYQAKDFSKINVQEYLQSLTRHLYFSYCSVNSKIEIHTICKDIYLNMTTAVPLGIIINEIISNALKYAFLDRKDGLIEIKLTPLSDSKLQLTIKDNGIGIPADVDLIDPKTFGLYIVNTLTKQIDGEIIIHNPETGTEFIIDFYEQN